MRLPSRSKSKSEVSGQSGHCSARLLTALRAKALNRYAIVAAVARPERYPQGEIVGSEGGGLS